MDDKVIIIPVLEKPRRRRPWRKPWILVGCLTGIAVQGCCFPAVQYRDAPDLAAKAVIHAAFVGAAVGLAIDLFSYGRNALPSTLQFNLRTLFLLLYGAAATAWTLRNLAELYRYLP